MLGGVEDKELCKQALRRGAKDFFLEGYIDTYLFGWAIRTMIERKRAEEELFIEKERASVVFNSIGDSVLSTDVMGQAGVRLESGKEQRWVKTGEA